MQRLSRLLAFVAVLGLALFASGCGVPSNNKGKIEGKWKVVSFPDKLSAEDKAGFDQMAQEGVYFFMEFTSEGVVTVGFDGPQKLLDSMKAFTHDKQITWEAKYKLRAGDEVEFYDLPKEMQANGGLLGSKATIQIQGTEMKMTDADGTATLQKMQ
jgi:hypothetical protein